jgi:hypothetical protein
MKPWLDSLAFVAVSLLGGAVLAGLVYLAEIVSRMLPVQPWSWGAVIA